MGCLVSLSQFYSGGLLNPQYRTRFRDSRMKALGLFSSQDSHVGTTKALNWKLRKWWGPK